jgi:HAD superfamily hydrolase (TIGR01509 family)
MSNTKNKGVLFDLDGVISDTQDLHAEVESEYLREFNIHIQPDALSARFAGFGDKQMFKTLFAEHGMKHPIEEISQQKWKRMTAKIEEQGIKPVPYVLDLIKSLHENDFVLAIASGSPVLFIEQVMEALSLQKYFAAYVSVEEVAYGKPAPDVFLEAAKRANIDINQCIIIEDGISGMQAAATAGIPCLGLIKDESRKYPTDWLVTSFKEVSTEKLGRWIEKAKLPVM